MAHDSLKGVPRLRTNPSRWDGEDWRAFVEELLSKDVTVREEKWERSIFVTDAGGLAFGLPHGVVRPSSTGDVSRVLKAAQAHQVPVITRGGGLSSEGEAIAFGGLLLDMTSMSRVLGVDKTKMTVRTEAGIFWHHLAEVLRRDNLDYLSAPLNLTSTVGGVLGVGGIDINSGRAPWSDARSILNTTKGFRGSWSGRSFSASSNALWTKSTSTSGSTRSSATTRGAMPATAGR
ncbi:MAG: FAD-dependent oxidoreductase [Deltaproteobacteria bacterium]|nr:FAD-dependent oxidoreductase [Deltaproteobacteria bacterium]